MRFRADNQLRAYQDHLCSFYDQIPPGIDFRVSKGSYGWYLCSGDCYGNGSLTVFASDTPKRWREKLDAAAAAELR